MRLLKVWLKLDIAFCFNQFLFNGLQQSGNHALLKEFDKDQREFNQRQFSNAHWFKRARILKTGVKGPFKGWCQQSLLFCAKCNKTKQDRGNFHIWVAILPEACSASPLTYSDNNVGHFNGGQFSPFWQLVLCTVATMWAIFTLLCQFWPTVRPSLLLPYFLLSLALFPGTKPSSDLCWLKLHY